LKKRSGNPARAAFRCADRHAGSLRLPRCKRR